MSALTCEEAIRGYIETIGGQFFCAEEDGRLWLVSPYAFPDGTLLEIALKEVTPGQVRISDLGETLRHLASVDFDPRDNPKGEYLLAELVKQHHVELVRGAITKQAPINDAWDAIQEVMMACLGVAHLVFLSRTYNPATFADEVAHLLIDHHVPFTPKHEIVGRTGQKYVIDFLVHGRSAEGLIQTLAPKHPNGVKPMVNATFRLWSDVANGRQHVTLLDDRAVQWKTPDLLLLNGVSNVIRWSDRDSLLSELAHIL